MNDYLTAISRHYKKVWVIEKYWTGSAVFFGTSNDENRIDIKRVPL